MVVVQAKVHAVPLISPKTCKHTFSIVHYKVSALVKGCRTLYFDFVDLGVPLVCPALKKFT